MAEKAANFIISVFLLIAAFYLIVTIVFCYNNDWKMPAVVAREEGYAEGYDAGYSDGYSKGAEDQQEDSFLEYNVDGYSLRDVVNSVYAEYGMYPHEIFRIIDDYEFDPNGSGISWAEYKRAVEAMYYTLDIIPAVE